MKKPPSFAAVGVVSLLAITTIKALPTFDIRNIQNVVQLSKCWTHNLQQYNVSLKEEIKLRPIWEDVSIWCFNRESEKFRLTLADYADFSETLQRNRSTVLFVHGWLQNKLQFADGAKRLALAVTNRNYCVVDFEPLATVALQLFSNAVSHRIAAYLAGFVQSLGAIDIPPEQVALVGEGASAHLAGQTGRLLGGHLGSIIGLDPLGPFSMESSRFTLNAADAQFVQVWYSSAGQLGSPTPLGHQNGLRERWTSSAALLFLLYHGLWYSQPVHYFVVEVFKATLDPSIDLLATKCPSYKHFLAGRCQIRPTTRVTKHRETEAGSFYLQTSCKPPYLQCSTNARCG